MDKVYVYVNHGRWIADCARPYCNNAVQVSAGATQFQCGGHGGCGLVADLVWPSNAQRIWDALAERPVPATRNWFPAGHELALRGGLPHGQSVADLVRETKEHGGA